MRIYCKDRYTEITERLAETVSLELTQETTKFLSRPQIHKLRRVETETALDDLKGVNSDLKETVLHFIESVSGAEETNVKCYNC